MFFSANNQDQNKKDKNLQFDLESLSVSLDVDDYTKTIK